MHAPWIDAEGQPIPRPRQYMRLGAGGDVLSRGAQIEENFIPQRLARVHDSGQRRFSCRRCQHTKVLGANTGNQTLGGNGRQPFSLRSRKGNRKGLVLGGHEPRRAIELR